MLRDRKGSNPNTTVLCCTIDDGGLDSVFGVTTRYGSNGPVIESMWGEIFRVQSRLVPRSTQVPVQ